MAETRDIPQRIARLTPFPEALDHIYRCVSPVAPRAVKTNAALGRVLAASDAEAEARPGVLLALRDGWAVSSEATLDAGSYAPAVITPAPVAVQVGDALPANTDAVAAPDAVEIRDGVANALVAVAPGEGVLTRGADVAPGATLFRTGHLISRTHLAVLSAMGRGDISVRAPRVRIVSARPRDDVIIESIVTLLSRAVEAEGGVAIRSKPASANADGPENALLDQEADAFIVVGGSGSGERDHSVQALARLGQVAFHGVGLSPAESTAFGTIGPRPVLVVPGRLDAALAAWLALGRYVLALLTGRSVDDPDAAWPAILARKITSTVGLAEVIVMRRENEAVVPLASGYLSLQALAGADGWFLVPADSEGIPADALVIMKSLP